MSAQPVDVLAVMDALSKYIGDQTEAHDEGATALLHKAEQARAAVAKLVADGWNMVASARHTGQPIDPERLAAALARVGGA